MAVYTTRNMIGKVITPFNLLFYRIFFTAVNCNAVFIITGDKKGEERKSNNKAHCETYIFIFHKKKFKLINFYSVCNKRKNYEKYNDHFKNSNICQLKVKKKRELN